MPTAYVHSSSRPGSPPASDIPALVAICALVVIAPELLGGVYPWTMLTTAGLALVALALTNWSSPDRRMPVTPVLLMMGAALLFTLLQALPLPCGLTRLLAPTSADELERARRLLALPAPGFCPITRDPAATREEAIKGFAIVAAFWSSLALSRRGYRHAIIAFVVASGVVLAVAVAVHAFLGAKRVFGLYTPIQLRDPLFVAPIMNLNTCGGFLVMCTPPLIGMALGQRHSGLRMFQALAIGLLACCVFMTRSRGAIGALVGASLGFGALAWRTRTGTRRRGRGVRERLERLGIPLGIAATLALAAYGWNAETVDEFESGGWDKLKVIEAGARFAWHNAWLGVGRGAFGSTFMLLPSTARFDYAENFVVQWAAEWGLPLCFALLGTVAFAALRSFRDARSLDRLGALVGLGALAAQNLVDIGFELVGLTVVAAVLFGAAVAHVPSRSGQGEHRFDWRVSSAAFSLAGGAVCAALTFPVIRDHRIYLEQRLTSTAETHDHASFAKLLSRAVLAHPSEPAFPLLASFEGVTRNDPSAGRWINRALQLAPNWSASHLQAARWLWNGGHRSQAELELGIAADIDPYGSRVLLCPIGHADAAGTAAAIPKGPSRRLILNLLAGCVADNPEAARRVDAVIAATYPRDPSPHIREGRRLLAEGLPARALQEGAIAQPDSPESHTDLAELRARALAALGRLDEATRILHEAETSDLSSEPLFAFEAEVQQRRGDRRAMLEVLDRMRARAVGDPARLAGVYMHEAALESMLGDGMLALRAYEQAYSIDGSRDALAGIAGTAQRIGDRGRALWAYRQLCDLSHADRDSCAKRDLLTASSRTTELPGAAAQQTQR